MEIVQKSKKKNKIVLLLLLLFISLGYAVLNANLKINGTSKINNSRWSIYFNNVVINNNSVTLSTGDSAAAIKQNDATEVNYTVTLNKPGDFYEFTVDAVNDGTVDAMIDTIVSTYKIGEGETTTITSNNLPSYLTYSTTYSDNKPILQNQYLKAGTIEKYKVRIEYKKDISNNELVETDQSIAFSFIVNYKQADSNAIEVRTRPVSFATDDWKTIIDAVQNNNTSVYHVGDTKTVDMGTLGTHTLRVANNSTPEECEEEGFSQTACGFVLEFADIITTYNMNPPSSTNVGGWPASKMRTYINNVIYKELPKALKNSIIDTTIISGHGLRNGETNFTSTDKLYLLSTKEVGYNSNWDTAKTGTRTLDYYKLNNNNQARIKMYNENETHWWLRSAYSDSSSSFNFVSNSGGNSYEAANGVLGVSPAFRIGKSNNNIEEVSLSDDDWDTIISAAQAGDTSVYSVGSTKTIDMGEFGIHTVRVANNSTTAECQTEGFSQTACGFVLEFTDIITTYNMNPPSSTNVGGWPASAMRTYLNNDIYNALPITLKNAIIETTVISGHGLKNGETNFTSTDKLYLLSTKELGYNSNFDTAKAETRIFDYYNINNSNEDRIKMYNDTETSWWLRSAYSDSTASFNFIHSSGGNSYEAANGVLGVSPAFRLG